MIFHWRFGYDSLILFFARLFAERQAHTHTHSLIEAVVLCSPVVFQCRHVKQRFKIKSFSNRENNSNPTPDNVDNVLYISSQLHLWRAVMLLEKGHRIGFAAVWQWIDLGLESWLQSKANVLPNQNYTNPVPFLYYEEQWCFAECSTIRVITSLRFCLCVCNQWVYVNNCTDAVDQLLILFGIV